MCIICGLGLSSGPNTSGWTEGAVATDFGPTTHPGLSPAIAALLAGTGPTAAVAPVGFDILNSAGATQAEVDQITTMLTAAWNTWAAILGTELAPRIRLEILGQTISGRFQGGAFSNVTVSTLTNGLIIADPVFNQQLRTGVDTNGTANDFTIQVNLDYFRNTLFMDPSLSTSNDIPGNRTDAFSVMLHEMGHALGFNGYGASNTGNFRTIYDYRTVYDATGVSYFSGPNTLALLGGALPLTTGNTAHYGNSTGAGANLVAGYLMNGVVFYNGYRYQIGALDLAVLEDIGLPTIRDAVYDQIWMATIDGGAGIDTFQANYFDRTAAITLTVNATSFSAPGSTLMSGSQTVTLRNIERLNVTGGSGNDVFTGGDHVDTLRGGAGNDILRGNGGADILDGGAGFDIALYAGLRRAETADTLISIEEARFVDGVLTFDATSQSAQVMRLYSATLNRVPDQAGLEANVAAFGTYGLQGLANLFVGSAEFQNRFGALNNQQFVEQMYVFALGRNGDPAGIQAWVNLLNGGATRGQVVVGFSESAENVTRTAATLAAGLWVPDAQAQIIARLYDATFDRLPDPAGLAGWVGLFKGGMALKDIAASFAGSAEFQNRYGTLSNQQFVEQLYRFCLNREGDAAGVSGWTGFLNNGMTRADVLLSFSESPEHAALTAASWLGGIRYAGYVGSPVETAEIKGLLDAQILTAHVDDGSSHDPADLGLVTKHDDAFVLPSQPDGFVDLAPRIDDALAAPLPVTLPHYAATDLLLLMPQEALFPGDPNAGSRDHLELNWA